MFDGHNYEDPQNNIPLEKKVKGKIRRCKESDIKKMSLSDAKKCVSDETLYACSYVRKIDGVLSWVDATDVRIFKDGGLVLLSELKNY